MQLTFTHQDKQIALAVEAEGDGWRVRLPDGSEHSIVVRRLPDDVVEVTAGARTFRVPTARTEREIEIAYAGETYTFQPETGRRSSRRRERAPGALTAPMAGVVVEVMVVVGQSVAAYQPLAAIEAMKVYATVEAPTAGTVTAVHVQKGERVAHGALVVEIAPMAGAEESAA